MRTNMGLPPLFTCVECDLEIDPKANATLHLVRGWTRNAGKTIVHLENEEYVYLHEHCHITRKTKFIPQQDSLF